jgi:hypothetical protein
VINPASFQTRQENSPETTPNQLNYWQLLRLSWIRWQCYTAETRRHSLKRTFDMLVSGILLLLLSPLFFAVAVLIRIDSPGAPFFYQNRVGKGGKTFKMWKFRSMYLDAEKRKAELMAKNEMAPPKSLFILPINGNALQLLLELPVFGKFPGAVKFLLSSKSKWIYFTSIPNPFG